MTMSKPSAANTSAKASPMPEEAPVMSAVRFTSGGLGGDRVLHLEDRRRDRGANARPDDVEPDVRNRAAADDRMNERGAEADRRVERTAGNGTTGERARADGEPDCQPVERIAGGGGRRGDVHHHERQRS